MSRSQRKLKHGAGQSSVRRVSSQTPWPYFAQISLGLVMLCWRTCMQLAVGGIFASVKSWYPEHSCSKTEGLCGLHCSGSSRVWRLHFAMHQLLTAHKVCSEPDLLKSSVAWSKPPNSEGNLLYCLSEDDRSRFHCSVFSVPVTSADSTPVVTTGAASRRLDYSCGRVRGLTFSAILPVRVRVSNQHSVNQVSRELRGCGHQT